MKNTILLLFILLSVGCQLQTHYPVMSVAMESSEAFQLSGNVDSTEVNRIGADFSASYEEGFSFLVTPASPVFVTVNGQSIELVGTFLIFSSGNLFMVLR